MTWRFFRISSRVGGGEALCLSFSTSWKFIHSVAGIYYTNFFVIFQK